MKIIAAARVPGGLDALAPVAEAVFGRRERAPGWFARKLARELVSAELSAVVCEGSELLGYALLSLPPSRASIARGAGLGLVASARGQGWGRALVEFVVARATDQGYTTVEFLTEDPRLDWYRSLGFAPVQTELTLEARGSERDLDLARVALPPTTALGPAALWSWFPEAWLCSPAGLRLVIELDAGRVWLIREGRAWIALRAELRPPASAGALLTQLRARLDRDSVLLLYPCPAEHTWVREAIAAGFEPIQRATLVRRPTSTEPGEPV